MLFVHIVPSSTNQFLKLYEHSRLSITYIVAILLNRKVLENFYNIFPFANQSLSENVSVLYSTRSYVLLSTDKDHGKRIYARFKGILHTCGHLVKAVMPLIRNSSF